MQFLGAITAIEVILKVENSYSQIINRIYVLLDEEFHKGFVDKSKNKIGVFDLRHNIIHDGQFCNSNDSWRAMRLSSSCIIAYSKICKYFSSKEEICNCLSLLYNYKINNQKKYSKDFFKFINNWENIKFDTQIFDWIKLFVIQYYDVNNPDKESANFIDLSKAIDAYAKYRKLRLEKAFIDINPIIIMNSRKFKNFDDFNAYYKNNIETIDEGFKLLIKYHKLEGTDY